MSDRESHNLETNGRGIDWKEVKSGVWRFMRVVLIIVALVLIGVGLSFFFWGEFSMRAYSDRLAYAGIGAIVVGGFAVVAALNSYSTLGTPSIFTATSDARIATERIGEYIRMNAKRHSFTFRLFAVAIICLVLSALIELVSR